MVVIQQVEIWGEGECRLSGGIRTLYHATTLDQAQNLLEQGVQPRYQKPSRRLDFGPGFYMTSQLEQAREFPSDFWVGLRGIEFRLHGDALWQKLVMGHRSGRLAVEEGLDYVYGPVADNLRLI